MSDNVVVFPDADLLDIATAFLDAIVAPLGGRSTARCAVVCYPLAGYLSFLGLDVTTKETTVGQWHHVWIVLPDGRVLDPTADQFDATLPRVYLGAQLGMHDTLRAPARSTPR